MQIRSTLSYLVFPLVFIGALLSTRWALTAGLHGSVVVFVVSISAGIAVSLLERWMPYETQWSQSHGDVPTDLFYAVFSIFAAPRLFDTVALVTLLSVASSLSIGGAIWPSDLPWGVQLVLAVVVAELGSYGWHRLMHEWAPLFRLHATHHSSPRLYWLNATRFHPLDNIPMYALHVLPLTLAGADESVLVGFTVWSLVHGFFQHANVDMRLGPLNYVFSMAELHRWHHSRDIAEANHNYGSNCIVWDLVFGTFYWPRQRRSPVDVGLSGLPDFPQRVVPQLLSPFLWPTGRRPPL
jgi:sterol desaturase/sphingolipid hydroxylase (fatty acid hydroxylase superfamily)